MASAPLPALLAAALVAATALAGCSADKFDEGKGGIEIEVLQGNGERVPIAEAIIYIPRTGLTANTDAQGKATFRDVPVGNYTAQAYKEGYEGAPQTFDVVAGKSVRVVFLLDKLRP